MVTTATPAPEAPSPAPVSSIGRIFGVLFSPKATFASIALAPTWILPLVLFVIVGLATSVAISQHVGWRTVIDKQISNSARAQKQMDSMTPEARETALNTQAKYTPYFVYPINFLAPFLGAVVVAAILLGAFNLILGAKIGFKTSLSIVSYSWVPGLIAALLGIAIVFLKDPSTIDVQNLVASNPGAILSDDSPKWLVSLMSSLDLFSFWTMILMAFGYSAADPKKLSFGKAFGTVFGVWIVYVVIKVGWVAAFS